MARIHDPDGHLTAYGELALTYLAMLAGFVIGTAFGIAVMLIVTG